MNIKQFIITVVTAVILSMGGNVLWEKLTKAEVVAPNESDVTWTMVASDTMGTDRALLRSNLRDSYEIWYKWIVFVDYDKSKISIPEGKDFNWVRRSFPHMYQRETLRVFINSKQVPEREQVLQHFTMEENTEIVGITALQYGWYYGNVPTE